MTQTPSTTALPSRVARALGACVYARKVVRDLLWAATSPHLIDGARFPVLPVAFGLHGDSVSPDENDENDGDDATLRDWLAALERDPAPLIAFLQEKTKSTTKALALGVYFASLLEFWLLHCPLLRVVRFERGKQIISANNQTLGQLKFLFRVLHHTDDDDAFDDLHVESSVKFFLLHPLHGPFQPPDVAETHSIDCEPVTYSLEQFVGPHLGENLAWRVQEVARKLDMCRGDSVQAWLRDHYSDRVASRIVLKGYLFYPLHHFASTSEVARGHDWCLHRTPMAAGPPVDAAPPTRHNPQIGADHLRGWWASDLDAEFASRVRANDAAGFGESRFVVLPKLHWLTSLLAVEDADDGRVIVQGEVELHIETVESMTLSELLVFARAHFASSLVQSHDAAQPTSGGVVMPLLVAEIVRCRPSDLEFDLHERRWKELSRGFLLDPKSWDPLPLCHDAVRYKRTNDDDLTTGEREYEARREWVNDGVIKPTAQEAELARQKQRHAFATVETMTPEAMCQELLLLLGRNEKSFTHANLKQSVQSVLTRSASTTALGGESPFLLASIEWLVLTQPTAAQSDDTADIKVVQRVAHLLLDAFEGRRNSQHVGDASTTLVQFMGLFHAVSHDETRWDYLNLTLRAIDIHQQAGTSLDAALDANGVFAATLRRLLQRKLPRWNAVAVEIVRVVYADATTDAALALRREMLATLETQHDWKHAEQLVVLCCHRDVALVTTLYQRFSALNMTKPMKRLRKVLGRLHQINAFQLLDEKSHSGAPSLGLPLNAEANRARVAELIPPLQWTLADTTGHIEEILAKLRTLIGAHSQKQPTIIGLDCEWRPDFLVKENESTRNNDDNETTKALPVKHDEGVSVYQIAVADHVYVVDVQAIGTAAAAPLAFIWAAPRGAFLLVGFCVSGDLSRLHHSFPSLLLHDAEKSSRRLLIELKHLALYRQLPATTWGLSQLYEACFSEQVDKEEQCSDWALRPLSESQLHYAARDAYAVRNIALYLLADVAVTTEDLTRYVEQFAVGTSLQRTNGLDSLETALELPLGHWLTPLAPLDESHVRAALEAFGLVSKLFVVDKAEWQDQARLPDGLVVKTIAVALRRGGRVRHGEQLVRYAAVVLHVDRSIDMVALASHFDVPVDDVQLADRETLLRVFGYSRGSIGPIGLRKQRAVHVVLDAALLGETAVLPGAGKEDLTYAITPRTLVETVGASVVELTPKS